MTYCIGLKLKAGLVLLADTRTNAGIDNIARFRKMFVYEQPGERAVALMTAGNLGVTQGVVNRVEMAVKDSRIDPEFESILNCDTLYRAAQIVGEAMRDVQKRDRANIEAQGSAADATIIVAGQRKGGEMRLFVVYPAGNFIEAGDDTPFLQIGEHKYGKPILDRVIKSETTLDEAIKAALVSMDSTLRSNLSVGMPLDMAVIEADTFHARTQRIEHDHKEFRQISDSWAQALREAFSGLPSIAWRA
jgi:putative proteasome-type protease